VAKTFPVLPFNIVGNMGFSESQFRSLQITEHVVSALSLSGTLFIISTFLSSPHFRKPINRIVFYASFGNIFMSIGTLISREGIKRGPDSALCQFQAFLLHEYVAHSKWEARRVDKLTER
jgi:hypothetical protein